MGREQGDGRREIVLSLNNGTDDYLSTVLSFAPTKSVHIVPVGDTVPCVHVLYENTLPAA